MAASPPSDPRTTDDPLLGARIDRGANIGAVERVLSIAAGAAVGGAAMRRGGGVGVIGSLLGGALVARGLAGQAPAKKLLGPNSGERALAREQGWSSAALVARAVTINKPAQELYDFFRDFANLPKFMENIERIDVIDGRRSHWVVSAPAGTVEWDAIVTDDEPGRAIGWESAPGADIRNLGRVEFRDAPQGRGTEVHAVIAYEPPMGTLGRIAAKLTQREPGIQARRDLKRFKMLMEAGEIANNAPLGAAPKA